MPSKVAQTLGALFDGVSRLPQVQRRPGHLESQVNMVAQTSRRRIARRPPLEYVTKVLTDSTGYATAFVEEIYRSEDEQYIAVIINGDLKVYDLFTGAAVTVDFPDGKGYLTGATDGFRAVTIDGDTIILNRTTVASKGTTKSAAQVYEALVYVRQGDYESNYSIKLGTYTTTHTTPVGPNRNEIATDYIADALVTALQANYYLNAEYTFTKYGSAIHITRKDSADFSLTATDGLGDLALVAIKGSVQRFTDLPPKARVGMVVEVKGDDSTKFDNYFVTYAEDKSAIQGGIWKECAEPDSVTTLKASTLPHRLAYKGKYLEDFEQGAAPVAPTTRVGTHVNGGAQVTGTIIQFDSTKTYAPGSSVVVSFPLGLSFAYQNATSAYATAATMCAGLQALVDAHANTVANVIDSYSFETWRVIPSDDVITLGTSVLYSTTTRLANESLAMTVNEHAGRTIRNLSDGSSATITSNTAVSILSAALAGGADNRFDPGDVCEIVGSGTYFIFEEAPWEARTVGTLETAPFPSFTDKAIGHVFEHRGRLGFLSGSSVIFSRPGDIYNLFRGTATQALATDPIDAKSHVRSGNFTSAVNWNGGLLMLAEVGQFFLTAKPALTNDTLSITQIGEYKSIAGIPGASIGSSAFFLSNRSSLPTLWDMRLQVKGDEQYTGKADDVTDHAPGYVLGDPLQLIADDSAGMIFLRTDDDRNKIFVYASQYNGPEREQASWSEWTFGDAATEFVSLTALRGRLTVLTKDADGVWLHTAQLEAKQNPARVDDHDYDLFLDRLIRSDNAGISVVVTGPAAVSGEYTTTWTLPYATATDGTSDLVPVLASTGEYLWYSRPSTTQIRCVSTTNLSLVDVYFGVLYQSRVRLSTIFYRDQNGVPITTSQLGLNGAAVRYEASREVRCNVISSGTAPRSYDVSQDSAADGILQVPIASRAEDTIIDVFTYTPFALNIAAVDWRGERRTSTYSVTPTPVQNAEWLANGAFRLNGEQALL